ncbi:MAG: hypothetical protein IJ168_00670 [Eubacterium sp.]|nr:hypothetical protein [Eubacterium sp.]
MKRIIKLISLLLVAVTVFCLPPYAYASTTTSTIFNKSTYTHQTKLDGMDITQGIDVSYHNGTVDFKAVKNAGVQFVILRVGYRGYSQTGNIKQDTMFETYVKDAHAAGLDIGVYFYSQALNETEAKAEANFVINALKPYKSYITMPVAFDYEFADVSSGRLDAAWNNGTVNKNVMTKNAIAFCDTVQAAGYDAMVYANKSFLSNQLDHTQLEKSYAIWLANYTTKTTYSGNYQLWQFTERGTVSGISGYVDCNFMYNAGFEVATPDNQVYTGKALTPAVKVTSGGNTLTLNTDYTLEYQNNIALGEASVTVTGKGKYAACPKITRSFDIMPDAVTGLKATAVHADTLSVTWNVYQGATGYQVWIKEPTGWKNLGLTTETEYTFTGVAADYAHDVSVRAYVKAGTREIYGIYGDYLHVQTKKYYPQVTANFTGWKYYDGYWFYFTAGKPAQSCWKQIKDIWYYFDDKYRMHTGWLEQGDKIYYLKDSGAMAQYFTEIDDDWYYFTGNGNMRTGWMTTSDKRVYYLGTDGKRAAGFCDVNGERYYFNANGVLQTGWLTVNNQRFYAAKDGKLARYSQLIQGEHYYFTGAYVMKTGWLQMGGAWYYFGADGIRQTGWITVKNLRYYLNDNGKMQTGWLTLEDKRYYLRDSGAAATGWCKVDDSWYYFNTSAQLQTGWKYINKKWYYFKENGVMVRYRQTIDGKQYYFTGNGDMYYGWLKIGGNWYYYGAGGAMVTGKQTIGGKTYTFDANGVWQS